MDIPLNNTPELAQWYLERGYEEKADLFYGVLAFLLPILAPIIIPLVIAQYRRGKRKVELGEAMNAAAGRENYKRPTRFAGNEFHRREPGPPDTRYGPVPSEPPEEPIFATR